MPAIDAGLVGLAPLEALTELSLQVWQSSCQNWQNMSMEQKNPTAFDSLMQTSVCACVLTYCNVLCVDS